MAAVQDEDVRASLLFVEKPPPIRVVDLPALERPEGPAINVVFLLWNVPRDLR